MYFRNLTSKCSNFIPKFTNQFDKLGALKQMQSFHQNIMKNEKGLKFEVQNFWRKRETECD